MTDTLPISMTYQQGSLNIVSGGGSAGESAGVITWTGALNNDDQAVIEFGALLDEGLEEGNEIVNTAVISGDGMLLTRTAMIVVDVNDATTAYMPFVSKAIPLPSTPVLNAIGHPNSNNSWTVSWSGGGPYVISYELQEAQSSDFSGATTTNVGDVQSTQVTKALSWKNEYFYRVRALSASGPGDWSNVRNVIGGYRDDFTDANSGWALRRLTLLEETVSWYENGSFVLKVEDSWDWAIAAPYAKAPSVPYAIEFQMDPANLGNLVSGGGIFGGDWPGAICPDYSTLMGLYYHDLCFNHFYNTNTIWYGDLKMLFERVDFLQWCPSCGGSPLKRLSYDYGQWFTIDPLPNVNDPDGWNTYRIEVRADGIKLFVNGGMIAESDDTMYVNEPFFGVFASTDEYSNSTWKWEYYQVVPLDN
jgi:hypothetical protein